MPKLPKDREKTSQEEFLEEAAEIATEGFDFYKLKLQILEDTGWKKEGLLWSKRIKILDFNGVLSSKQIYVEFAKQNSTEVVDSWVKDLN